jgi:hypothetical protein
MQSRVNKKREMNKTKMRLKMKRKMRMSTVAKMVKMSHLRAKRMGNIMTQSRLKVFQLARSCSHSSSSLVPTKKPWLRQ